MVSGVTEQQTYFQELDKDQIRDSLKYASDDEVKRLAPTLTPDQLRYLAQTLDNPLKVSIIKEAIEAKK